MNDRELERLIRMACDADELERSARTEAEATTGRSTIASPLRLVGGGTRRWLAGLGIGAAAAASLLGAIVLMQQGATPVPAPRIVSRPPHRAAPPAAEPDECVVLAVYRGSDGQCSCVQLKEHEWGGRSLADIPRHELLDVAFREACSTDAQQVFVVAVEDRPDTLPRSREEAEAIADRLSEASAGGRFSDVSSYAYAAMPTLSPGATVVAERVAVRPTPLKQAAALVGAPPVWGSR